MLEVISVVSFSMSSLECAVNSRKDVLALRVCLKRFQSLLTVADSGGWVGGWWGVNRGYNKRIVVRGVRTTEVASTTLICGVGMRWCLREDLIKIAVPPEA
ncbi:hypothetical protein TNCV_4633641 [Trichonephila clavipes]|nr:hypothetical protein TNCV_4633641 [Trichonephila clavipes]